MSLRAQRGNLVGVGESSGGRRCCCGIEIATAQAPRNDNLLNSEQLRLSGGDQKKCPAAEELRPGT